MNWLRKYWIEILVLGVIFGVMVMDLAPDFTWMNVDSDGAEYVMDAIYFYPAHHTSAPLYLLMGHVFEWLPIGTIYWRMSLMSALFTLGSMIFIYLTVIWLLKENKRKRLYALLAVAIFGGSALVIAQAVIVETYAVVTYFSVGAYYFAVKKNWVMASVFLGMGLVTHHLIFLTWFVLFLFHKEMRNWKKWGLTCAFLIFYIYMPLSVMFTDQPNMWGNTTVSNFLTNNLSVFTMLVGQIAIYDLPKRILDTFGVLGISLGVALILIVWYFFKVKTWKNELMWLFALPIIYYMGDLAPQVAKYVEASIAWGAIITAIMLTKVNFKWVIPIGLSAVTLLGINGNYWDIGRTLDKDLAASKFYYEELPKIPDGDIFITNGAWEWIEVFLYNKENNRHIIPVCVGILASPKYQDMLKSQGVKLTDYDIGDSQESNELNKKQVYVGLSIIAQNDNVWTTVSTDPSVYGAMAVPARGHEDEIGKWLGEPVVTPQVHWIPSNPYDVITGSIEVEQWIFILQSNKSAMWLFVLSVGGGMFAWYITKLFGRKKKGVELGEPTRKVVCTEKEKG